MVYLTAYGRYRKTHEVTMQPNTTTETPVRKVDTTATIPATMRAIVQSGYGSSDVLEVQDVPTPTPGDEQVLIKVEASSLNIYDHHMISGTPAMVRAVAGFRTPKNPIPGADVAGTVVAVGKDVNQWKVGDEVFGDIGAGAFAEYAVGKEKAIARMPEGVAFEVAATVPLAALTALQGLRDIAGLQSGQKVIINGASGGVGTFAVQIAKALGGEVTAVCSTQKVDAARSIGADTVIDYTADDYTATERDVDVLFDNAGNRP
ncbi:MAG: NAD(P)-dependent alcohol dehydrogenase, partial [Acidimicrobiia bacterium]